MHEECMGQSEGSFFFSFASCHGVNFTMKVGSPLWSKEGFIDTCHELGEGAF